MNESRERRESDAAEEAGNERARETSSIYPGQQRERMSRQRETVGLESSWLETHLDSLKMYLTRKKIPNLSQLAQIGTEDLK